MTRAKKLLIPLIIFAIVMTVFSVVALANSENSANPVTVSSSTVGDGTFTSSAGTDTFYDKEEKIGKYSVITADNGNVYIRSEYAEATGTDKDNVDIYVSTTATTGCSFADYAYLAVDFDVMTENGTYGNYASFAPALYNGSTRIKAISSTKFNGMGLSTTPYEWQHVTLILEHTGNSVFKQHYYVNGVHTVTSTHDYSADEAFTALNGDFSELSVGYFRMYPSVYSYSNALIGIDNYKFTYFPSGYCGGESDLTKIATYYYNESYVLPYRYTVATVTDSEGNVTYYDDINKAIAAAGETDVIKLFENVTEPVIINKKITVDRNIYDENGATGELYTFEYTSSQAFVDTETAEGSGIFSFAKSKTAVDIIWDEACAEDCDCYSEFGGHVMTSTSIGVVGELPEYFGTIPSFKSVDGYVKKFEGWSYENDGSVDVLVALTAENTTSAVKLYPVYSAIQYDFEYSDGEGNKEFFFADRFEDVLTSAVSTDGASIVLHNDITYYKSITLISNVSSTLDLNGHTLTRINLHGNAYKYDVAVGGYVATDAVESALNAFISSSLAGADFTITSSKENAVFKTASAEATIYYDESGKLAKYEATAAGYAGFIYASRPSGSTINISNITIFATNLLYNSNGNTKNFNFNVNNCKFYKTVGAETSGVYGYGCIFIDCANNAALTFDNSLFYIPSSSVISNHSQFIRFLEKGTAISATFNNCDIISDYASVSSALTTAAHNVVYNNCRVYNIKNGSATYPSTFGNDTVSSTTIASNSKLSDGCVLVDNSQNITYSLPTNSRVTVSDDTNSLIFNFGFADRNISFTKEVKLYREVYATVNWLDENGKLISTNEELKNSAVSYPEYISLSGDGYRGIVIKNWLDENGNAASFTIGDADTYSFKANPVIDENTEYTAKITEAQFNFIYYSSFETILYLPVDKEMDAPTVSEFTKEENTVAIDGVEYWAYAKKNTTTNVADDTVATVSFTKGGTEFTQNLTLSALLYAEIVLTYPENDIESRAIANMIRYIKEARSTAGLEISERFAEIEALYPLDDYKAKDEYDILNTDVSGLYGYVNEITFMIHGSSVSYVITLTPDAIANGAVLSMKFADSDKEILLSESDIIENGYYTLNTRVYDLTKLVEISVTVTENGEEKTATGTYSLGTYIAAKDNALAKALYEFGNAAATYREYLIAKYDPTNPEVTLYTATFKADGVTVGEVKFNIVEDALSEPAIPEKTGYTGAWESYVITNSDIVINAVYTPITYKITYNVNNTYATHTNPDTYTVETETFEISTPVSEGDTFLGWYLDEEFTTAAPASIVKGSYGNITLYGNWDCIHEIKITSRKDATPLKDGYETTNCVKCYSQERTEVIPATKSIKLLAIGNSFSIDALEHFGAILTDAGVENITIANLYDAGCSINEHLSFIEAGTSNYTLYLYNSETKKMVSQGSSAANLVSLEYGLSLADWDIITMQQASGSSYKPTTYDRLDELVDYVRGYNTTAKLYWHMTWAYDTYHLSDGRTSVNMYEEIVDAVSQKILTRDDFSMVLPSGTAIENIRTSAAGPNLTRDGYHLSYGIGRYTAALTWFAYICDVGIEDITWTPTSYPEVAQNLTYIKEAVNNAVLNQFGITASLYPPVATEPDEPETPEDPEVPEEPDTPTASTAEVTDLTEEDITYLTSQGLDSTKYKRAVLTLNLNKFYNSTSSANLSTGSGSTANLYVATQIFDKSELIDGSIIRLITPDANGDTYKYRPEAWIDLSTKNTSSTRPKEVTSTHVVIDSTWWGDFNYRGFNIKKSGITLEEAAAAFIIYIPANSAE